jgi:hypothetical protein
MAIASTLWSGLFAYFLQPYVHQNSDALNVIVTVFSILAGFLVAIIAIIGDAASLPAGSWRVAALSAENTQNRLVRHKWLFIGYLVTLALVFLCTLAGSQSGVLVTIAEYLFLFIGSLTFILSFQLPGSLMQLQKERIDREISARRQQEGIQD